MTGLCQRQRGGPDAAGAAPAQGDLSDTLQLYTLVGEHACQTPWIDIHVIGRDMDGPLQRHGESPDEDINLQPTSIGSSPSEDSHRRSGGWYRERLTSVKYCP